MNFLLSIFLVVHLNTATDLHGLRQAYFHAAADPAGLPAFKTKLDRYAHQDHYFYCYLSAYHSLSSRHASSITKKMAYFNLCKKQLGQSLELKETFDAHFIRFCVQNKSPGILGYKSEINTDKAFILKNLGSVPNGTYKQKVKSFLKDCAALSKTEKEQVDQL